jgi:hypothetical protein
MFEQINFITITKLENKLTFSDEGESDFEDIEIIKSLSLVTVQEKGKRVWNKKEYCQP